MLRRLKLAILALPLLVQPLALHAQVAPQPAPATPAPAPATLQARPALWAASDGDTTIYLFGTIHVLKAGTQWFDGEVRKAFDASDEVALEMVMPDPRAMQGLIQRLAISTGGQSLPDKLGAPQRAAYLKALSDLGLPANTFDRTEPWFAATNLSLLPIIKLGYDPAQGVEAQLTAAAKTAGKPVIGLETAEQQLGYFKAIPERGQIAMLNSTVEQLPKIQSMIENMVGSWARAEPDKLAAVMNDGLRDTPDVERVLLTDRNVKWADWIDTRLSKPGTVFLAVGAGHLAGRDSVIAQLEKRKVKVRRVI